MNKKFFFRYFVLLLILAVFSAGFLYYRTAGKYVKEQAPDAISIDSLPGLTAPPDDPETVLSEKEQTTANYPAKLNLNVPFFAQAPKGDWSYPYQEACEEASVLTVANLYLKMGLTVDSFDKELLKIVDWEVEKFGSYLDTTVEETAQIAQEMYGLKTKVHVNPDFKTIQAILNKGHLIIAPFAGRQLGNPNFRNGGPKYHMLVIKGYDATQQKIVTNDVGTRNGSDYVYTWDVLYSALHDWNDGNVESGAKKILEVWND